MKIDIILQRMEVWLTERHLEHDGGYPHDCRWVGGDYFVVADLDDGKDRYATKLVVLTRREMLDWYARAEEWLKEEGKRPKWPEDSVSGFGDWGEALWETQE